MNQRLHTLRRTERLLLGVLAVLLVGLGGERAVRALYLEPRILLEREIDARAASLYRMQQLEARATEIQRAYDELQAGEGEHRVQAETQSTLLLEIEKFARETIRLHSVQPRSSVAEGESILHLSIEASSDLAGLGEFLQLAIAELGTRVTSLTLTADAAGATEADVRSRIELEVSFDGS